MKMPKRYIVFLFFSFTIGLISTSTNDGYSYGYQEHKVGEKIDSLNGVYVYFNGSVGHVLGRNIVEDGYNLGLKYQCVEFVKRYYYEYFNHKMPDSYGHAKDFFDDGLGDGQLNIQRGLVQYCNSGKSKPQVNDLIVFKAVPGEPFGHVAIVSAVYDDGIEIIQQNPLPGVGSREVIGLEHRGGQWVIADERTAGWLRKEN